MLIYTSTSNRRRMNVIIDSPDYNIAKQIADDISKIFDLSVVNISCIRGIPVKSVIVGAPSNTSEYRQLSSKGFIPDLVIHIGTTDNSTRLDQLELYYEGNIISLVSGDPWLCREIIKLIHCELTNKKY